MEQTAATTGTRHIRPRLVGVVTSDKAVKTIKVEASYLAKHRKYGKYVRRRTVVLAHDPEERAHLGDRVEVMACRPVSKTKRYRLLNILHAAPREE